MDTKEILEYVLKNTTLQKQHEIIGILDERIYFQLNKEARVALIKAAIKDKSFIDVLKIIK